jgi:hypothetical protein
MAIYLSAGASTIAALIGPGRIDTVQPPPASSLRDSFSPRAAIMSPPEPVSILLAEPDLSRITRRCERAVVTAYRDLRAHGADDLPAFRACTTLYRIHHPEASVTEARRLVAEWIDHHLVHREAGPTPGCDCD